ncbi:Ig-like domain-containing protein [Aeromicrobium fastidiosum]|uniref:Ig-like domain-containing protein n=1 Tax=Aeromicrobium fastidiosum TaxID=52699 RepID=UPI0020235992|nr:Ig-like domain-containing protein [Aeromicrobium fastidiosum]MCL8251162.1 Ig-like domain-containing protein [Aeromicrobium fastidiosum]
MSLTTRARRGLATAVAGALAAGGLVALAAAPAQAATRSVSDVDLTWSLSNEQGGGAFFGGCNFLSAGKAGNTGSSRLWTEADGFYRAVDGNVSVEKPDAAGVYSAPSWSTKCQDKNGAAVSASSLTSTSGNRVKLSAGTGTIDAATGAGTITWKGSFTSAFYGGLTYWSATDPMLEIAADGTGTLKATASGYGADMNDAGKWNTLTPRTVTLAQFADVDVTSLGFTATPTYLGTSITTTGTAQPAKTSANQAYWGSFPQSYVDFQTETGQSSYWYTSGGGRDAAKPATTVDVTIGPKVSVSKTTLLPDGTQSVTVTGTGFDPSLATGTRPPFAGKQSGAYVAFGRYLDVWRPSAGAPSSARKNPSGANGTGSAVKWAVPAASFPGSGQDPTTAAYTELKTDGSFSTTVLVDRSWLAAEAGNFGIYTYAGGGANVADYETYTPITFAKSASTISVTGAAGSTYGTARTANVSVAGTGSIAPTGTVTASVGGTVVGSANLAGGTAAIALPSTQGVGTAQVVYSYAGDTNHDASSTTRTATVSRAAATVTRNKIKKAPTTRRAGKTSLSLRSAAPGPITGKVKVTFKKKGQKTKTKTVTVRNGKASVTIPKLAKGTWRISVKYAGSTSFAPTATKSAGTVKVTKK